MRLSESDIKSFLEGSTFGVELEIANADRTTVLPDGNTWCRKEGSIINKNRVGNDPFGEYNYRGGEIQVKPQKDEEDLVNYILHILELTKCETIRDPNTFHIHIRIPALLKDENIEILRHCLNYSNKWNPVLLPMVSDLPSKSLIHNQKYHSKEQRSMFLRAYRDKYRSRHSVLPESSLARVNNPEIKTVDDIINEMPPKQNGRPSWIILPRQGVNYRKLLSHDIGTVEFRCFSGSSEREIIKNLAEFPRLYFQAALRDEDPRPHFEGKKFPGYYGWTMEPNAHSIRWLKTDHDKVKREVIIQNVREMLLTKEITLGTLGEPEPFWRKNLGDQTYDDLLKYSRDVGENWEKLEEAQPAVAEPDSLEMFGT